MPEYSEDLKVIVSMDRYEELIRKAEHYDNIVGVAFDGAKLNSWNDELTLDTNKVETYLLIVEAGKTVGVQRRLLAAKQEKEEQA